MGYELDFGALAGYVGLFLHGLGVTLGLTATSTSLGVALSIGGAATAGSGRRWARGWWSPTSSWFATRRSWSRVPFVLRPALAWSAADRFADRGAGHDHQPHRYSIEIVRRRNRIGVVGPARGRCLALAHHSRRNASSSCVLPTGSSPTSIRRWSARSSSPCSRSAVVSQIAVTDLTHVSDMISRALIAPSRPISWLRGVSGADRRVTAAVARRAPPVRRQSGLRNRKWWTSSLADIIPVFC